MHVRALNPRHWDLKGNSGIEAWFSDRRRRRWIWGLVMLIGVAGISGAAGLMLLSAPSSRCDQQKLEVFLSLPEVHVSSLHQLCRLPSKLDGALRSMALSPLGQQRMIALQMASDAPELLRPLCSGYPDALWAALSAEPARQTLVLFRYCSLSDLGVEKKDFYAAPLDRVLLAMAIHTALKDSEGSALTRRLANRVIAH